MNEKDEDGDTEVPPAEVAPAEVLGHALSGAARRAGLDPTSETSTGDAVWKAVGGWRGIAESVLPSLAFIIIYTLSQALPLSLLISVGLAAVFTVVRLLTRTPPSAALGGLAAAAVAGGIALLTGRAQDAFILGFVTNIAYGSALLISALVGWSLIGLAVGFLMGEGTAWRADLRKRRIFFWVTLGWAALFGLRLAVQMPLYFIYGDDIAALGTIKIVMGIPLFAVMVAITLLAVRSVYRRAGK